ncbi:uncharacterized protein Triagg1_9172 [Trichoderma aggressivum f. europaeum]|uniref:Allantoate permease n=1 Tax=Trichoderma aggressivum f. europaeum TaxID=173218 RepID=A0AAE1I9D0_9HYPO|nr:hypothetical protein Triagg1_9172 [Trichoderma aggressivum f. europaeum]
MSRFDTMAALLHGDEKQAPPDESTMVTEIVDMHAVTRAQDSILDTVNAKYTKDEYKCVLKKIDRILLPLMWLCYGTQQADKTAVSTQATFGMINDMGLAGQQLSWLTTAFYIAYFVGETPGNYLMQRFSVNKTLFICMFCWSVVVLCIAFVQDFAQVAALRSLQGLSNAQFPLLFFSSRHPSTSVKSIPCDPSFGQRRTVVLTL